MWCVRLKSFRRNKRCSVSLTFSAAINFWHLKIASRDKGVAAASRSQVCLLQLCVQSLKSSLQIGSTRSESDVVSFCIKNQPVAFNVLFLWPSLPLLTWNISRWSIALACVCGFSASNKVSAIACSGSWLLSPNKLNLGYFRMHAFAYSYAGACLFQNGWWRHYVLFFWSFLSNHWCFENETADAHVLQLFCLRSITIFSSFWFVSQNVINLSSSKTVSMEPDALLSQNPAYPFDVLSLWPFLPISCVLENRTHHCHVAATLLFWNIIKCSRCPRDARDFVPSRSSLKSILALDASKCAYQLWCGRSVVLYYKIQCFFSNVPGILVLSVTKISKVQCFSTSIARGFCTANVVSLLLLLMRLVSESDNIICGFFDSTIP